MPAKYPTTVPIIRLLGNTCQGLFQSKGITNAPSQQENTEIEIEYAQKISKLFLVSCLRTTRINCSK